MAAPGGGRSPEEDPLSGVLLLVHLGAALPSGEDSPFPKVPRERVAARGRSSRVWKPALPGPVLRAVALVGNSKREGRALFAAVIQSSWAIYESEDREGLDFLVAGPLSWGSTPHPKCILLSLIPLNSEPKLPSCPWHIPCRAWEVASHLIVCYCHLAACRAL